MIQLAGSRLKQQIRINNIVTHGDVATAIYLNQVGLHKPTNCSSTERSSMYFENKYHPSFGQTFEETRANFLAIRCSIGKTFQLNTKFFR